MSSALISIKPVHVKNILSGKKTVEIRTRNMLLPIGSTLWIYSTLPTGKIEAIAEIDFIDTKSPSTIWRKHKELICISKNMFDTYTHGRKEVTAIGLKNIEAAQNNLCLKALRKIDKNFMPPQFFLKITPDKKIYQAFA